MKQLHAYLRDNGGLLTPTNVLKDGEQLLTMHGWPLEPTGETTELRGWGNSDGQWPVYENEGGREFVVVTR